MIDGNIEEALNLLRVQVHRENPVRAGGDEQVGDELGGDGHARPILAIPSQSGRHARQGNDTVLKRAVAAPPGLVYRLVLRVQAFTWLAPSAPARSSASPPREQEVCCS